MKRAIEAFHQDDLGDWVANPGCGPPLAREALVEAGQTAVIVPEVKHRVRPESTVRFFVEFHRRP